MAPEYCGWLDSYVASDPHPYAASKWGATHNRPPCQNTSQVGTPQHPKVELFLLGHVRHVLLFEHWRCPPVIQYSPGKSLKYRSRHLLRTVIVQFTNTQTFTVNWWTARSPMDYPMIFPWRKVGDLRVDEMGRSEARDRYLLCWSMKHDEPWYTTNCNRLLLGQWESIWYITTHNQQDGIWVWLKMGYTVYLRLMAI